MGYDLHITRRKSWADTGNDITADEWLAYVRGASDLEIRTDAGSHFAVWNDGADDDHASRPPLSVWVRTTSFLRGLVPAKSLDVDYSTLVARSSA